MHIHHVSIKFKFSELEFVIKCSIIYCKHFFCIFCFLCVQPICISVRFDNDNDYWRLLIINVQQQIECINRTRTCLNNMNINPSMYLTNMLSLKLKVQVHNLTGCRKMCITLPRHIIQSLQLTSLFSYSLMLYA